MEDLVTKLAEAHCPFIKGTAEETVKEKMHSQILAHFKIIPEDNSNTEEGVMKLLSGLSIGVAGIPNDANCLFRAIAPYIDEVKNSKDPLLDLRQKIVATISPLMISNHIDSSQVELWTAVCSRLVDEGKLPQISDMEAKKTQIRSFLFLIINESFYGGKESLIVISIIFEVNILVFEENGTVDFIKIFNPNYSRTICLAIRLIPKKCKLSRLLPKKVETGKEMHVDRVTAIF